MGDEVRGYWVGRFKRDEAPRKKAFHGTTLTIVHTQPQQANPHDKETCRLTQNAFGALKA